jgi:hypothetical protein
MARRAALRGSHLVALALPQITVVPVIVPALATHVSHRDQLHRSSTVKESDDVVKVVFGVSEGRPILSFVPARRGRKGKSR